LQKLVAVGHALVAKPEGDEHSITDEEWRDPVIRYAKLKTLSYEDRERETRKLRIVYSEHPFYSRSFVQLTDVLHTDVSPWADRCTFIKTAAEAFITFGIPTHSMGSHIDTLARVLDVDARFFVLPHYTTMTFRDLVTSLESTTTLALRDGMALGKLTDVHVVFKGVLHDHDQISAADGTVALRALLKTPPEYGLAIQVLLAFLAAALVGPLGFGGSLVDAVLAGAAGVAVASVKAALGTSLRTPWSSSQSFSYFVLAVTHDCNRILTAAVVSFAARALNAASHNICCNAVTSSAIVTILPGYLILTAALEICSQSMVSGAVRMVYSLTVSSHYSLPAHHLTVLSPR
jgi:uncharacterized membrane protein YjjP (DUF1212 family)